MLHDTEAGYSPTERMQCKCASRRRANDADFPNPFTLSGAVEQCGVEGQCG